MRALITGGAGFIGSHLAQRLLDRGDSVTVIDDLSTGTLDNIKHLLEEPEFEFVHDTVRNQITVTELVRRCDTVYHLAAAVGVKLIAERPVHTIETNIHGTEVILQIANTFRKKVLLASSSEVYGKSEAVPFREDDDMVLGSTRFSRWAYACSKAVDEFLGLAYYQQFGLPVIIARFFNTIGPRQTGSYGMVVPRFVRWALQNEPVLIYGSGEQSRCFCCVSDVVEAIVALADCADAAGRPYNIGSPQEISIKDLADTIIRMTGSTSEKKFISYEQAYGRPMDDMMRRCPSLDRIRDTAGWQPNTSLEQSLQMVIDDMKKQIHREHEK